MANIRLNYIEGKSYNLTISVQNTSTRGGLSAAATMKLGVSASLLNGVVLIPGQGISYNFAAGEQRSFLFPFTVPAGTGGLSGTANATIMTPDGVAVGPAAFADIGIMTSTTAVAVSSIPNGASIYINGTLMGQTPVTISLVSGTYTITFKLTGYQDYTGQFTLTGEYTSTSLGVTLAPIPPPATPHLTFGILTGSYTVIYGGYYPILRCKITNNNEVAIIGRDILAFNRYTSPYSGLPVEYSGSIKDTTKVYGVPAYGPAPGLITLQPGASIDIDWMPNFSIPRDVVNSLWLFDTITGDKSNIIYLP